MIDTMHAGFGAQKDNLTKDDIAKLTTQLLNTCGGKDILHIGQENIELVQSFLSKGAVIKSLSIEAFKSLDVENHSTTALDSKKGTDSSIGPNQTLLITQYAFDDDGLVDKIKLFAKACKNVFLCLHPTRPPLENTLRSIIEHDFFALGFRKHPAYYRINNYESLESETGRLSIVLENLPSDAFEKYPMKALQEERDLHMDMTRESGSRSDAHIIRYLLASQYVRPGDRVLDAACGLGYGTYLLSKCTEASTFIGIDGSDYAIEYAQKNFGKSLPNIDFKVGWLPEAILELPANSVDLITSFETLEHVKDPEALLSAFKRVLSPSGRIIVSVPNDWSDESGEDPNPYHYHVYTWSKIIGQMEQNFLIEKAYAQTANQFKKSGEWEVGVRKLEEEPIEGISERSPECEWCLVVGFQDPAIGLAVPYSETTYDLYPENKNWYATKFDSYLNPWLVKGIVTIGHRVSNPSLLTQISAATIAASEDGSADKGAGLCVYGYQLLESSPVSQDAIEHFQKGALPYFQVKANDPHVLRWQVSLAFLLAKLWQKIGHSDKAIVFFRQCIQYDCSAFSITLVTKQIQSHFDLGVMLANYSRVDESREIWKAGIIAAQRALSLDWRSACGSFDYPSDFGLYELGAIIEHATACAYALRYIHNVDSRPSQWWHNLQRDRISQLGMLESMRSEVDRLNKLNSNQSDVITSIQGTGLKRLEQLEIELGRLNVIIMEKDSRLSDLGTEIGRLNSLITEKDLRLQDVGEQLHVKSVGAGDDASVASAARICDELALQLQAAKDLHAAISSELDDERKARLELNLENQKLISDLELSKLEAFSKQELENELLHQRSLNETLKSQLADVSARMKVYENSRLLRWQRTVKIRPITVNSLVKSVWLTAGLLTPLPIRQKVVKVLEANSKKLNVGSSESPKIANGVYVVKQPAAIKKNRPKVCHVIANFMTGGSSRLVVDIYEYMGSEYDQAILTSYIPVPPAYVGIPIEELRFPEGEAEFINYFRAERPDIIHVHYWGDCDEPWYAKAIIAAESMSIPVIQNVNTPVDPFWSDSVKKYVYVSDYVKEVFGKSEPGHITVYPGSDFSIFEPTSKKKPMEPTIGMVYRLERDKLNEDSILPFILAAKKLPALKVIIVGGGSLLDHYQTAVKNEGVSKNFEFTGYVSYEELPDLYSRMALFVAPVWKESFGQVSPFAMNMKVPVVGYDVGALAEIVQDRTLLANYGDAEALSNIILELLANPAKRNSISEMHREIAQKNFSIQSMIERYKKIYKEVSAS